MNNNDIFKKLRVALQLRDDQIIEILELVDFRISKGELGAFFRSQDHPNYMECGDQVLRNFLNGLVIHLRGTKDNPKNPMDVLNINKDAVKSGKAPSENKKQAIVKSPAKNNATGKAKVKKNTKEKPKQPVVEKVKFNNGKKG